MASYVLDKFYRGTAVSLGQWSRVRAGWGDMVYQDQISEWDISDITSHNGKEDASKSMERRVLSKMSPLVMVRLPSARSFCRDRPRSRKTLRPSALIKTMRRRHWPSQYTTKQPKMEMEPTERQPSTMRHPLRNSC
jgi:hypothetical protein